MLLSPGREGWVFSQMIDQRFDFLKKGFIRVVVEDPAVIAGGVRAWLVTRLRSEPLVPSRLRRNGLQFELDPLSEPEGERIAGRESLHDLRGEIVTRWGLFRVSGFGRRIATG